jgi:hypothetical protein
MGGEACSERSNARELQARKKLVAEIVEKSRTRTLGIAAWGRSANRAFRLGAIVRASAHRSLVTIHYLEISRGLSG